MIHLDGAIFHQQNIASFEVTMNNSYWMAVVQCLERLPWNKLDLFLVQTMVELFHYVVEGTALAVFDEDLSQGISFFRYLWLNNIFPGLPKSKGKY